MMAVCIMINLLFLSHDCVFLLFVCWLIVVVVVCIFSNLQSFINLAVNNSYVSFVSLTYKKINYIKLF